MIARGRSSRLGTLVTAPAFGLRLLVTMAAAAALATASMGAASAGTTPAARPAAGHPAVSWALTTPDAASASTKPASTYTSRIATHQVPPVWHELKIEPSAKGYMHPDAYTNGCSTGQAQWFHMWSFGNWVSDDGGNYCVGFVGITDLPDNSTTVFCPGNNAGYFQYVYNGSDYQKDFTQSDKVYDIGNLEPFRILHVNITSYSGPDSCPFSSV